MVARVFAVAGLLAGFPAVHVVTPAHRREGMQRRYARMVLRSCGIRLRIIDNRGAAAEVADQADSSERAADRPPVGRYGESGRGLLVVAGHVGWTDIIALAAVQPLSFVARADLIDWPLLGRLARMMRVIPIERERLRGLPAVVDRIGDRLVEGERIGVFPEGTTWCGRAYGRLRPALFQAAVDTATPVQPVRLRYLDRHGVSSTVPGFVGDDTMLDSIRRVLSARGVLAEVVLEPVELPGTDRHDLARRCERAVRGELRFDFAAHAAAVPWRVGEAARADTAQVAAATNRPLVGVG